LSFFNIKKRKKNTETDFVQFLIDHFLYGFCFVSLASKQHTHKTKKRKRHTHKGFNQTIQTQKKKDYEAAVDDGGVGVLSFVIVDGK